MHKVARLRTDFFKEHPAYETLYNEDRKDEPTRLVNKELRTYIDNILRRDYVDTSIVTEHTYRTITAPLIEAL